MYKHKYTKYIHTFGLFISIKGAEEHMSIIYYVIHGRVTLFFANNF